MTERKQSSISIDIDTNKMQLKLRAIAKHAEALANELDTIDNAWQCECGSDEYEKATFFHDNGEQEVLHTCLKCGNSYCIDDDSLPTRLEGSD